MRSRSHFHGRVVDIDCSWLPFVRKVTAKVTLLGWGSQIGRLQARTRAALYSLLTVKLMQLWHDPRDCLVGRCGKSCKRWHLLRGWGGWMPLAGFNYIRNPLNLLTSSPLQHISVFMLNSFAADHWPANHHPLGCWHRAGQVLLELIVEVLLKLYQVASCQDHGILILLQASVQKTGRLIIAHEAGAVSC